MCRLTVANGSKRDDVHEPKISMSVAFDPGIWKLKTTPLKEFLPADDLKNVVCL